MSKIFEILFNETMNKNIKWENILLEDETNNEPYEYYSTIFDGMECRVFHFYTYGIKIYTIDGMELDFAENDIAENLYNLIVYKDDYESVEDRAAREAADEDERECAKIEELAEINKKRFLYNEKYK